MCADLSFAYVVEFACKHLLADRCDKVGKDASVQMAQFVLHHTAAELVEGLGDLLKILVVVFDGNGLGTHHIGIDSRNAEAAFGILALSVGFGNHYGIDKGPEKALQIREFFRYHISIHDYHPLGNSNLGCCKTASVSYFERILEVLNKGLESLGVIEVERLGYLAEHFRAIKINRLYHFFLSR